MGLYKQFLTYTYGDLQELFKQATSKAEQDFYVTLMDFKLQQAHLKILREE